MRSKKIISLLMVIVIILSFVAFPASASEPTVDKDEIPKAIPGYENIEGLPDGAIVIGVIPDYYLNGLENTFESAEIVPFNAGEFYYRKANARISNSYWSPVKRISDNVLTGAGTGTITATATATFNGSASGAYGGLNFSLGTSLSSSRSYSLTVPSYSRVYMAYRVYYQTEVGTREKVRFNGVVTDRDTYSYTGISHGEYLLINV